MLEVMYEDKDILVVIKPRGIPCQKDLTGDQDVYTELKQTLEAKGDHCALGLVQRLDRPVGGIIVLSKSPQAAKELTRMVTNREIGKYYLALVDGVAKEEDQLEHWLQKVRGNRSIISNKKVTDSKSALLDYKLIEHRGEAHEARSLLEVHLHTGRHHQIRAQLAHMKLPLVGDTKYNPSYKKKKGWYEIGLYAYRLEFNHPVTHEKMAFKRMPDFAPFV